MWPGLDLEFQLARIPGENDQEVLGIKLRVVNYYYNECIKLMKQNRIGFLPCEDGVLLRAESYKKCCLILRQHVPVQPLPTHLETILSHVLESQQKPRLTESEVAQNIPAVLWKLAKPYQKTGLQFIVERDGRAQLADDMGVGKTFQAILWSWKYKTTHGPVLVVCPTTLCGNWTKEIRQWGKLVDPNFDSTDAPHITQLLSEKSVLTTCIDMTKRDHYYIVPYSIVQRLKALEALIKSKFQMIVADETHSVKNEGAKRCVATQALCATAKKVVLLSGTPGVRPLEMFTQFSMVCPLVFPEKLKWVSPPGYQTYARCSKEQTRLRNHKMPFSFVSRWCDPWMETTFAHHKQWNKTGSARPEELHALAREFVFIRRKIADVLTAELPPKHVSYITMDITEEDSSKISKTMAKMHQAAAEHQDYERKQCFMEMYNDLPRIKTEFVKNHIRKTILNDRMKQHKCIIFGHHKAMIAMIEKELQECLTEYVPVGLEKKKGGKRKGKRKDTLEKESLKDTLGKERLLKKTESKDTLGKEESKESNITSQDAFLQSSICNINNPPGGLEINDAFKEKQTYIKISGETKTTHRQQLSEYFQQNDSCRIALMSLTAAGVGLNLFKASVVIMTEMFFTPGALAQAEARAHRLGCSQPVQVEYLIAKGTLDQALLNIVSRKTEVSSTILDGHTEEVSETKSENDEEAEAEAVQKNVVEDAFKELLMLRKS